MKKITTEWLTKQGACSSKEEKRQAEKIGCPVKIINELMKQNRLSDANWLIIRLLKHKDKIRYAVFAAEQVIYIYERKYDGDDRPRKAIEAAKAVIKRNSMKNRIAANAAANAAAYAADAATDAANAAANAAADAAAYAADAATDAATDAAYAAAYAADAATDAATELKRKIIKYGLELLRGEK